MPPIPDSDSTFLARLLARRGAGLWGVSFLLILPAFWPYVTHAITAWELGRAPTWFLIRDMPYYMANAREHFDNGGFQFFYGLPFSPHYDTPRIYFQIQTLLLGLAWRITNMDPGLLLLLFGVVAALVCVRLGLALYDRESAGDDAVSRWGRVLFVWGGGVLCAAGLLRNRFQTLVFDGFEPTFFDLLFAADPFDGWWLFYFGRNLVLPTEAYYHALFFGAMLCMMQGRWRAAWLLGAALSWSHPFTGIEVLSVMGAWCLVEIGLAGRRAAPAGFFLAVCALFACHAAYYLFFMNVASQEHFVLMHQWTKSWTLEPITLVAAHALVAPFALWQLRNRAAAAAFLSRPDRRLLLVWFLTALALSKHELFLGRAIQPLHFTRGYTWIPLFLMGLAPLQTFLRYWGRRSWGKVGLCFFVLVFLSDNLLWLGTGRYRQMTLQNNILVSSAQKGLFQFFNAPENRGTLVVTSFVDVGYLATLYSPLRSWYSHLHNTPYADQREKELESFRRTGQYLDAWRAWDVLVVKRKDYLPENADAPWIREFSPPLVFSNDFFSVFRVKAQPVPAAGGKNPSISTRSRTRH